MFEFYSPDIQSISPSIAMLPQKGSSSGPTHRPLNSFAILKSGMFILFDSPFSWTLDGVRELVSHGRSPVASFISHSDLAESGDAFVELQEQFELTSLLHATDQTIAKAHGCDFPFGDPMTSDVLQKVNVELIHIPGHTSGSIMLYDANDGFLLAGDSAVGPGPEQNCDPPLLQRPPMGQQDKLRFCEQWQLIIKARDIRGVLPLHGSGFSKSKLGKLAFDRAVENIWTGNPMNPAQP
jgi:glyoxylase-like metal-dependent hydrolase (beta-lactamase superfamily II)